MKKLINLFRSRQYRLLFDISFLILIIPTAIVIAQNPLFTLPTIYVDGSPASALVAGTWQHVVITTDTAINASDFDIGRIEGVGYYEGQLDDIRLYNYTLTPAQIKTVMNGDAAVRF